MWLASIMAGLRTPDSEDLMIKRMHSEWGLENGRNVRDTERKIKKQQ